PTSESQPTNEPAGTTPAPSPAASAAAAAPAAEAPAAEAEITVGDAPAGDSEGSGAQSAPGSEAEEGEVQVLGSSLSRAAGSAQVLTERQLKRFEYDDPSQALLQIPGVYLRQEDGIGLRPNLGIRGGNPDRSKKLTLTEDGVLFGPAPYSAPAAYFFPLLTRMTEIRVVKGPAAIAYGPQTVGGAVDFVSRPIPLGPAGAVDLAFGEFGYSKGHVHFGTSTEQFGFLIEGVRLQNTGFAQLPSGADTGSTRNEWVAKASYVLDPQATTRNEFLLKLTYSDEVSNESYLGQSDADFRENPYRRYPAAALDQMNNHRTALALTHVLDARELGFTLKTTVYRNDFHRIWKKFNRLGGASASQVLANPNDPANQGYYDVLTGQQDSGSPAEQLYIGPNDRNFVSQGIQTVANHATRTGPLGHRLEGGLRLHNDEIRRLHTETAYDMRSGQLVYAGQPTLTTADNRAATYAAAIHVTDAITWKALTVTPGMRVELIQSEAENFQTGALDTRFLSAFLPGAGAFFEMLPGWGVLGGVYRGFSPPAPGSEGYVEPEYSVNYEAGSRFVQKAFHAEAIGFYNDYSNLTDVCTLSSGCIDAGLDRQFDAGAARIYGVEALVGHEMPLPASFKLPFSFAYTYSRGEFLNSFQSADPIYGNVVVGDEIPYIPPHQFNATAGIEHKYAGVNATLNFIDRMREQAGQGAYDEAWTTDTQTWLDLSAYAKPLPWLTIYANLRNVTGEAYIGGRRPYGARSNPPRWFQMGAKAEF
ncbi:MAG TPA: TonB-dependent receptor, partial [Polyangiaceae bacterium]|nr:TonB-dependent receptor [Polyangiaceae bacterium]